MRMHRVGVIGCRGIGVAHASGLEGIEDKAALIAGCDLSEDQLAEFKARWADNWPDLKLYTSHREMLEKENLDVVTVATSDHRHADLVVDAAETGVKGIFCEKPMATNLADADRMIEACERNGTVLSIDHTRRWMPLWRYAKTEIIDKGVIGPVRNVISTLYGPRAMLFRNGTHMIDAICYYAKSEPEWVFAELEAGYEDYSEYRGDGGHDPITEPGAHGYIHFANGVRGIFMGGPKDTPSPKTRMEIVCSEGYVLIDNDQAKIVREDGTETIEAPEWSVTGIPAGVQELIEVIDGGGEPVSPGREALKVVEIMIGFLESQKQGNTRVALPLPRD